MPLPSIKNRVGMSVSGTPGTGPITLNAADTGYQSFATAYGANANVDVLIIDGTAWEVARDCTYTHSGTTLSRGTLEESSTGSALSLTSAAKVYVTETAERVRRVEMGYLEHSSHDGSAAVTGVVGTLHVFTGLTADRDFTLPASAAVGDRVGITFPAGSSSYEILLKSASGDKINNVDCSTTEWSRLFIAGETVIFRCIDSSTVDWVVEYDGRIPQVCEMYVSTATASTEAANTFTKVTDKSGAWTAGVNIGSIADTSTGKITLRRSCKAAVSGAARANTNLADQVFVSVALYLNGTLKWFGQISSSSSGAAVSPVPNTVDTYVFSTGDYVEHYFRTQVGSLGAAALYNTFSISEIL